MSTKGVVTQPLSPKRSLYLRQTALRALELLQQFSQDHVTFGPTALQLLDEWIERLQRKGPVSAASKTLIIAFLGHTFLFEHGGHWATAVRGQQQLLGVVCPVAGPGDRSQFIDIVEQVNRRLSGGIRHSLAFFYLTTSVDLQGRS